jgi:hypothetical protein
VQHLEIVAEIRPVHAGRFYSVRTAAARKHGIFAFPCARFIQICSLRRMVIRGGISLPLISARVNRNTMAALMTEYHPCPARFRRQAVHKMVGGVTLVRHSIRR